MTDILADINRMMREMPRVLPPLTFHSTQWMTVPGPEDWSDVRSPGRAARRRRQGHRQRIRQTTIPDPKLLFEEASGKVYGHPETISAAMEALNRKMGNDIREHRDALVLDALKGKL